MLKEFSGLVNSEKGLLDRKIFSDPEIYRQEMELVFGRCWLFVAHESQIPKPNDFSANYMGEDPVLVTRDSKGNLHTFLNMCRHRGNRICRADFGNAPSFMCTYHGWTFATDGKLVGVPGYKEAYFEELDRSQWGLVEAKTETYKGLVFATWDQSAPKLIDYLGDYAWYMDMVLDRRAGGTEAVGGTQKFVMETNWKFGADNFAGDGYHVVITHGSTRVIGQTAGSGTGIPNFRQDQDRVHVTSQGHGINSARRGMEPNVLINSTTDPRLKQYYMDTAAEAERRLGTARANGSTGPGNVFPNFTWNTMLRNWHPRGPMKTEIWSWRIVDKEAPREIKDILCSQLLHSFGPAGNLEQDDGSNFVQCTASAKSPTARKYPIPQVMGLGHEFSSEIVPGTLSHHVGEANQRGLYARWAEIMSASSWDQIRVEPRRWTKA